MVVRKLFGFLGCALALASSTPAQSRHAACLNGLTNALRNGSFSGSLDCQADSLTLIKIGTVRKFDHDFTIYDYRYKLHPVCPGCAIHGGQRVIIMERGRYLGQYTPGDARVTMHHGNALLSPNTQNRSGQSVAIGFSVHGPPDKLWFDGELLRFFR